MIGWLIAGRDYRGWKRFFWTFYQASVKKIAAYVLFLVWIFGRSSGCQLFVASFEASCFLQLSGLLFSVVMKNHFQDLHVNLAVFIQSETSLSLTKHSFLVPWGLWPLRHSISGNHNKGVIHFPYFWPLPHRLSITNRMEHSCLMSRAKKWVIFWFTFWSSLALFLLPRDKHS